MTGFLIKLYIRIQRGPLKNPREPERFEDTVMWCLSLIFMSFKICLYEN